MQKYRVRLYKQNLNRYCKMKDAGGGIDHNKVQSKVYSDATSSPKGATPNTKKYLVVDYKGKPVNAEANFVSKMSRKERDEKSPAAFSETLGSTF